MTVKYNVVERGNPTKPGDPKKFYPSIVSSGRVTMRQMAEIASERSTLSTMDMMAAYESLLALIPKELAKGNIVELGDFGNFWLKNNAEGADTAEGVTDSQITTLTPRFNPGVLFKDILNAIKFTKA